MKHVLFLAPSFNYVHTVIQNLAKDMEKHNVEYKGTGTTTHPFFITNEVEVMFVIDDPAKWQFDGYRFDEVYGKKELVDVFATLNPFRMTGSSKKKSLSKYIIEQASKPDDRNDEYYRGGTTNGMYIPDIKNVYFNYPHTIVMWADGTKTIVKCQEGDLYDNQVGLAMAISKKALGNSGNYYNTFKKHLPKEDN
jgi:hypothetical protein